jgi:hypothetical protein
MGAEAVSSRREGPGLTERRIRAMTVPKFVSELREQIEKESEEKYKDGI